MTQALRAVLIGALALLALFPALWRRGEDGARVVRLDRPLDPAGLARMLRTPPSAVVRTAGEPPTPAELARLQAAGHVAPLLLAIPRDHGGIGAGLGGRASTGRAAALVFTLRGRPGDSVRVTLRDEVGLADSVRVLLDSAGRAEGAFRVRPRAAGWREWTVEAGGVRRALGAWVDSVNAPRVLVHAGLPGWESRFVVRALEESGARVVARYDLGRGQAVDAGGGLTVAELGAADVVLVMDGAPLTAAQAAMLAGWAERGGGVLVAGDRADALGAAAVAAPAGPANAAALAWRLPPELGALPPSRLSTRIAPLAARGVTARAVGSAPGGAVLVLKPLGRGRVAALGLPETWRWRMEAGAVAEHREFWRSLADHLARPARRVMVEVSPAIPAVGATVEIAAWGDAPGEAVVRDPTGAVQRIPLRASGDGLARGRYHPPAPGIYQVSAGDAVSGFRADASGAYPGGGWDRAALALARAGGRAVPADSLETALSALGPARAAGRLHLGAAFWLALLSALATLEWALRRVRGKP